jgi:hypothetical protein
VIGFVIAFYRHRILIDGAAANVTFPARLLSFSPRTRRGRWPNIRA